MIGLRNHGIGTLKQISIDIFEFGEEVQLEFTDPEIEDGYQKCNLCYLFHVHATSEIPQTILQESIPSVWAFPPPALERLYPNRYKAYFSSEEQVFEVLHKGPWKFDNHLATFV